MAPAKENGGLDNLAFDVSAIFYPPKNIQKTHKTGVTSSCIVKNCTIVLWVKIWLDEDLGLKVS